jgi:alpha-tubulin suppressor-like RCC1 family protein
MRRSDAHHPSVLSFGRDCGIGVKTVFERKRVACIAGGWKHSVLCSTAGDVYIWGWTPDLSIENSSSPQLVKPLALHRALNNVRFVKVAAGGDFSLALTEHGSVWSFGGNAEGQCGFAPNEFGAVPVPMLLLSLHKVNVTEVACGGAHCLARTDAGSVLSWGRGKHGCLGHGDEVARSTPTRVKALINVTGLACGWSHSLCVDSGGKVWAWGKGSDGQLGFGRGQVWFLNVCFWCCVWF